MIPKGDTLMKFYGYRRCSTSNKAQKYLDEHNVDYEFIDITQNPPTEAEFQIWLSKYQDRGLRYFFNTSGQHYRQMHLKDKLDSMTLEEASKLLASDGKLIKRPLITDGENLSCGFKEDVYQKLWLK